jgi:hypothetical protein
MGTHYGEISGSTAASMKVTAILEKAPCSLIEDVSEVCTASIIREIHHRPDNGSSKHF